MADYQEELYDEDGGASLDIKELVLYGVGRSRYILVILALVGLAGGLVAAASIPNNYTAIASLRYTPGLRELRSTPEVSLGLDIAEGVAPSVIAEVMLLSDMEVFRRVG